MFFHLSLLVLVFLAKVWTQKIFVDLSNPLLLMTRPTKISTIEVDYELNYVVGYVDGTVTIFNGNLIAQKTVALQEKVDQIHFNMIAARNLTLTNGTILPCISYRFINTLSKNKTRFSHLTYATYILEFYHDLPFEAMEFQVFRYTYPTFNESLIVFVNVNGIQTVRNGILSTNGLFDYGGNGVYATAAEGLGTSSQFITNGITSQCQFYIFLSNNTMNIYKITTFLKFNTTTQMFDATFALLKTVLFTFPQNINKIAYFYLTSYYVLQGVSGALYLFNSTRNTMGTIDPTIVCDSLMSVAFIFNDYYLLCASSIIEIMYYEINDTVIGGFSISLPTKLHNIISDWTSLYFMFDINFAELYKIYPTPCFGTNTYDLNTKACIPYTCTVSNCTLSTWLPSICNVCDFNFTLTENYTCLAVFNVTTNTTTSYKMESIITFWQYLLNFIINLLAKLISIPGARSIITPVFYYFGNFDDIYFYQFHDRLYGDTMNQLFSSLSKIQQEKWMLIDINVVWDFFKLNSSSIWDSLDYQNDYLTFNFSNPNHPAIGSESLLCNNLNFFLINVPVVFVVFIICRKLFFFLFQYPISKGLRNFALWGYLFLLYLDGNIEQFTYYLTNDILKIFFFNYTHKLIKLSIIFFGFLCFIGSISLYFWCYTCYGKLNQYILDNNINRLSGIVLISLQNGIYAFLMGILHVMLRKIEYDIQIQILICFELIFTLLLMFSAAWRVYKIKLKIWITNSLNVLRVVLISSFYLDKDMINQEIIEKVQKNIIYILITINAFGIISDLIYLFCEFVEKMYSIFKKPKKSDKIEIEREKKQMKMQQTPFFAVNVNDLPMIIQVKDFNSINQPANNTVKFIKMMVRTNPRKKIRLLKAKTFTNYG